MFFRQMYVLHFFCKPEFFRLNFHLAPACCHADLRLRRTRSLAGARRSDPQRVRGQRYGEDVERAGENLGRFRRKSEPHPRGVGDIGRPRGVRAGAPIGTALLPQRET